MGIWVTDSCLKVKGQLCLDSLFSSAGGCRCHPAAQGRLGGKGITGQRSILNPCFSFSLSVTLFLCPSLSLPLLSFSSFSPSLSLSLPIFFSLFLSLSLCFPLSLSLSLFTLAVGWRRPAGRGDLGEGGCFVAAGIPEPHRQCAGRAPAADKRGIPAHRPRCRARAHRVPGLLWSREGEPLHAAHSK